MIAVVVIIIPLLLRFTVKAAVLSGYPCEL